MRSEYDLDPVSQLDLLRMPPYASWGYGLNGAHPCSCLESHSLISYLLHSLAVRYAPSNLARERAQTFLNTYYSAEEPNREAGDRADRSKADAQSEQPRLLTI